MNTPRTDKAKKNIGSDCGQYSRWMTEVEFSEQLETELTAMTDDRDSGQRWASHYKAERDKWTELAAKYAQEREHNANMALAYQADLAAMTKRFHEADGSRIALEGLLETARRELAAMTAERDAFRAAFCNGPAYDTGETPEQARERFEKNGFIYGFSAVIIARELSQQLNTEREKCEKLEGIIKRAATKFCEDGPDGEIAAGMFRILEEKALEATK